MLIRSGGGRFEFQNRGAYDFFLAALWSGLRTSTESA